MNLIWYGVAAIAAVLLVVGGRRRRSKLPPGPGGFPLVAGLLQLRALRDPAEIARLAALHGPIFCIRLFTTPLIFVTGRQQAHEALLERGQVFASRPPISGPRPLNRARTVNAAAYGTYWRTARRNLAGVVATRLHRFSAARRLAVDRLMSDLRRSTTETAVTVRDKLRFTVFSILAFMCFGEWLEDSQVVELEKLMREVMKIVANATPSLATLLLQRLRLPNKVDAVMVDYAARRKRYLSPFIDRARRREQSGELDPACYLHVLFEEERSGGLCEDDILVLVAEFLNAGGDTTTVTLEWALACLIKYPQEQIRLANEIEQACAVAAEIDDVRASELRYLGAFVKEVLRTHPPGYSTLPHAVSEATKLGGYDIPTNSVLVFHTFTMGNDKEAWEQPAEFKPDRFLVATAGLPVMGFAPFGAGRRVCPGMPLAELHLSYILARLVQTFEWRSSMGGTEIDMSPMFEFTILMKTPLSAVISERKPMCC